LAHDAILLASNKGAQALRASADVRNEFRRETAISLTVFRKMGENTAE
jgi:hypothetical protein